MFADTPRPIEGRLPTDDFVAPVLVSKYTVVPAAAHPRTLGSNWPAKKREYVAGPEALGGITSAGVALVEAARADGRWDAAYAGSATMIMPEDLVTALETRPVAKAIFVTLDRKNLYPIYYRLRTAKRPETRARWLDRILGMLDRGKRFHRGDA